jgi:hypothetical protein
MISHGGISAKDASNIWFVYSLRTLACSLQSDLGPKSISDPVSGYWLYIQHFYLFPYILPETPNSGSGTTNWWTDLLCFPRSINANATHTNTHTLTNPHTLTYSAAVLQPQHTKPRPDSSCIVSVVPPAEQLALVPMSLFLCLAYKSQEINRTLRSNDLKTSAILFQQWHLPKRINQRIFSAKYFTTDCCNVCSGCSYRH